MPAAAVIPAPKAYTKVVAVEKLVVEKEVGDDMIGSGSDPIFITALIEN